MALAIEHEVSQAAAAAASAYQRMGHTVVLRDRPLETLFPANDPTEVVVNTHTDLIRSITYVADLAADGAVTVLVPVALVGPAHTAFRYLADQVRIQPWWMDDLSSVQFGRPEIP